MLHKNEYYFDVADIFVKEITHRRSDIDSNIENRHRESIETEIERR